MAHWQTDGSLKYETFIDGWLQGNKAWGRPVDLLQLPDGSLLISDDRGDVIYRLTFDSSHAN
jgi:glucose/arabinose dehydrogenase